MKYIALIFLFLVYSCSKTNLEKINQYLEKGDYERLLEFANKNKSNFKEEELYLSSVAVYQLQNSLRKNKSDENMVNSNYFQKLEKKIGLKIKTVTTDNSVLPVIDDVYEKLIPKNSDYRIKILLDRFKYTYKTNDPTENTFLLLDILEQDPRQFLQEYKFIWIEAMKLQLPKLLPDESKTKFNHFLHYLASKEDTDIKNHFFVTVGTNVNLRSGPGTENANIGKLNQEEVFQIDSDFNTVNIGNKTGKWVQIYIWKSDLAGWIFSPFLKNISWNQKIADEFERDFIQKNNFSMIDFNNWNPEEIPNGFYGNYIPRNKEIIEANIGFPVYSSKTEEAICKKLKKIPNKLLIHFYNKDTKEELTLFYLKSILDSGEKRKTLVKIIDRKLVLNQRSTEIELEKNTEQFIEIKIDNEEENTKLSLISMNNREYFDLLARKGEIIKSCEICIPQSKKNSNVAFLFSFKIY
ncbi:MAG TPA: SH3 domain-containing protein [Leptospiraceae bacterium]|nr:SH3 domain-containing protein [Leptospiraceae bacterium]HMX34743.1 SH3 domain-containing protein [Leptospiraceae bacterium]HMY30324.1 SH3 domain-containing protein [Leptospiraceae bacterium]HMZ63677.1 SH3 domain-containing protein [Leptospiraceae bacterium]HNA08520.1 SH3 domain-containing protein [Leptospiraceae bacterium]